jgi:hypothetical protein
MYTREKYRALLDEALREAKDKRIVSKEVSSKTLANANDFIDNQSCLELFDFPSISVGCDISILFEWLFLLVQSVLGYAFDFLNSTHST